MTTPTPDPATPVAPVVPVAPATLPTAKTTALRAYVVGLIAAVLGAAIPIVQASLGNVQWSSAWWQALGVAVLVPAMTAGFAYVAHAKFPPQ